MAKPKCSYQSQEGVACQEDAAYVLFGVRPGQPGETDLSGRFELEEEARVSGLACHAHKERESRRQLELRKADGIVEVKAGEL